MTLKKIKIAVTFVVLAMIALSCQKDNYDAPQSHFTGAITYKGDTVFVGSQQVTFELWQTGFGKLIPIGVNVDQDGSFSALLFDGAYKLDFPPGQGPFRTDNINGNNSDTIPFNVNGNTSLNVEVEPYYMIRNPSFSINGNDVSATLSLEKVITDANAQDVENVSLYVNKTAIVDNNNNIASFAIDGNNLDFNSISLSTNFSQIVPDQNYVFARIGVKIKNVEDRIYSRIVKLATN